MTWTVLGSEGRIGKKLVNFLIHQGHSVYAPDRQCLDVFDRNFGNVVYAIGVTSDFRNRPYDTVEAHVCFLSKFLKHAKFDSFLYLSSTRVYSKNLICKENQSLEINVQDPSDLYNISKLLGEALCFRETAKNIKVIRLSNVVILDDLSSDDFIPNILKQAASGKIVLRSNEMSVKDYIHINDVISLIPKICLKGRSTIYNVASGIQTTNLEWVEKISKVTGCKIEILPNAPENSFAPINIEKIQNEFNFHPISIFSSLTDYTETIR